MVKCANMARAMNGMREWLRPPRNLLLFFVLVVCLPAATVIVLGIRLLDQDRAISRQRQLEILDRAAGDAVRILEQDLSRRAERLAGGECPVADALEDAVCVVLRHDRIEAVPAGRIAFFPVARRLREAAADPFIEADVNEFQDPVNLEHALSIATKRATSDDAAVRAGALLRRGRILRKSGRIKEALEALDELSRIPSISINAEPADLAARRMRCAILEKQAAIHTLMEEAASLARDLHGGRWQLDREAFEYIDEQVHAWLGKPVESNNEAVAFSAALAWVYDKWMKSAPKLSTADAAGAVMLNGNVPVTILWSFDGTQATAFIAGPRFLKSTWIPELAEAVSPAQPDLVYPGALPVSNGAKTQRIAAETGLPWTVVLTNPRGAGESPEFRARRRNLIAGLTVVVIVIVVGSYFIWHAVNRELAVARLQSDFVSAVSHEFRTPLTALRQFNELLAEADGPTQEKRHAFYQAQTRATARLHNLVESLLDFGRMEAGRHPYKFASLDAAALAHDVTEEFSREASALGFRIACNAVSDPCPISADAEALSRALWNLLDNAIKYSGDSKSVEVRVERLNGSVSMAVHDYGIGVPASEQKAIFQKFVRGAASRSAGIRGTGLGLAMVQHIVRAHRGTVSVRSGEGEGATFTILLPAAGAE